MNLKFNRILMEEPSENVEAISTEETNEVPTETEVQKEEKVVEEKPKQVKKSAPKKKEKEVQIEEENEVVPEKKEAPKLQTLDLEQENLILKEAIRTAFDAEALTAFIAREVVSGLNPFENLENVVNKYIERYPQLIKNRNNKPRPTEAIAPSNQDSAKQKEAERRMRYLGTGSSDFFKGSGIKTN